MIPAAMLLWAATLTASVSGTVTSSGVPLSGVRVEVRGSGVVRIEWSGRDGRYSFNDLPAGSTLSVTASMSGFVSKTEELRVAQEARLDLQLALADVRTTVVVTDGPLSVRSDAPETSQTLTSE